MRNTILIIFCFAGAFVYGQNNCPYSLSSENLKSYKKIIGGFNISKTYTESYPTVRLSLYRIRRTDGSAQPGESWQTIRNLVDGISAYFNDDICFTVIEEHDINNDAFYFQNQFSFVNTFTGNRVFEDNYVDMINTNFGDNNSIRIYLLDHAFAGAIATNPIWDISPTDDFTVSLSVGSNLVALTYNTEILAHEIGHCLELLHTHQVRFNSAGDPVLENVTRAPLDMNHNCDVEGDLLCDTPADFNLNFFLNAAETDIPNCSYFGNRLDPVGVAYTPLTDNVMSYTHPT